MALIGSASEEVRNPMRHRRTPAPATPGVLSLAVLGALTLSACGASGQSAAPPAPAADSTPATVSSSPVAAPVAAGPAAVMINNFMFGPASLAVKAGSTVTWTNQDEEPHTVVGAGLRSPVLGNQGSTYAYTFTTPGTYSYNCSIHPYMHGTVTVTS
ncbi:MAG TPA: plastocyanin/azurin family copper-binding protein [Sporichthyaceae bacterium]|jgi:plastocyanin|nr:plastocyanin/azurin family copper-binding protein [Sporichthyaceae bacterium]